jgi:hypothetical protein
MRYLRNEKGDSSSLLISATLNFIITFVLVILTVGVSEQIAQASSITRISEGDEWSYFKGVQDPPRKWHDAGFDDSNWQKGASGLGYGIGSNRTYLGDMRSNYLTVYARREFTINKPQTVKGINLTVVCDGPFITYLNGIEVIRTNTIQISTHDPSTGTPPAEPYNISGFVHELLSGKNVLSVQCDNDDINSDDFSFIPSFEVLEDEEVR